MLHFHHGYYLGMHWVWWLLWLLLIIWIFVFPSKAPLDKIQSEGTLYLLKKRLARGEIDIKEYEERKAILLRS